MEVMSKKTFMAKIIITAFLISLVSGMQAVKVAKADPFLFGVPSLIVNSPPCNPYLAVKPTVGFSFDYYVSKNLTQIDHFTYSLDENANSTLACSVSDFIDSRNYTQTMYSHYSVSKTLENLSNGNHSVTFYAQFLDGTIIDIWREKIIVDSTYKNPVPLMISPLNQTTYGTKEVPVIFSVNSSVVGESLYSLDSSSNWPYLIGNGTLPNLSDGPHTLKLIVTIETQTDTRYVQYRETVYFNVDTNKTTSPTPAPTPTLCPPPSPTQQPTPTPVFTGSNVVADPPMDFTPTLILLAVITLTVAIGVIAYFYFKRIKK
jgi:hypothetical protein